MSLTGKEIKNTYNDLLHTNNSNSGVGGSIKNIFTGNGDKSALALSDRSLQILPNTDTTTLFDAKSATGQSILKVDATNELVTAGKNDKYVNTNVKEFSLYDFTPAIGYHAPMITNPVMETSSGDTYAHNAAFGGNGADPATTLDFSTNATVYSKTMMAGMWYCPNALHIDSAWVFVFCEGSVSFNVHTLSYTIATGTGTSAGDLSAGNVLLNRDSIACTNSIINNQALGVIDASISAGDVVFTFIESAATTQFSALVSINYHIE